MRFEGRRELVDGRGSGADLVVAQTDESLKLTQPGLDRVEAAKAMPIGAQVVGQLVTIAGVGLRARRAPPRARGIEGRAMNGCTG